MANQNQSMDFGKLMGMVEAQGKRSDEHNEKIDKRLDKFEEAFKGIQDIKGDLKQQREDNTMEFKKMREEILNLQNGMKSQDERLTKVEQNGGGPPVFGSDTNMGDSSDGRSSKRGRWGAPNPNAYKSKAQLEIKERLDKRLYISGFVGNSSKEMRINVIKEFLSSLGDISKYGELEPFTKDPEGGEVFIQFESKFHVKTFIGENIDKIKVLDVKGVMEDDSDRRKIRFDANLDEHERQQVKATKNLGNILKESGKFGEREVHYMPRAGVIRIKGFKVIFLRFREEGGLTININEVNAKDTKINGLLILLNPMVEKFKADFE